MRKEKKNNFFKFSDKKKKKTVRFIELCNQQADGSHVLIATGGIPHGSSVVDSLSEQIAKRLLSKAIEKKHNVVQYKDILQEPYAVDEFYR